MDFPGTEKADDARFVANAAGFATGCAIGWITGVDCP